MHQRFAAQLLSGTPAASPVDAVRRILAVQGQHPQGVRLAVRARTRKPTMAAVNAALGDGSLLITWVNRGTLHLIAAEDFYWLHTLTTPPLLTGIRRRLENHGVGEKDAQRAVRIILAALRKEGPLTRSQLQTRVDSAGVRCDGPAFLQILFYASLSGQIVRGPVVGKHHAYVATQDWIGDAPRFDRDAALAELARRYLMGHAPANERDLAYWAGLPLRDTRAAFDAISAELRDCGDGLYMLKKQRLADDVPTPRLLGWFDPVLHGWKSRLWVTGSNDAKIVKGGLFLPFVLIDGIVAGTWSAAAGKVSVSPFAPLQRREDHALAHEVDAVRSFLAS